MKMIFFYVLCGAVILAGEAYGKNLTELERKMIGGINAHELAEMIQVYPVYISKLDKPFLSGMRISRAHVLTVATHIQEIRDNPRNYKVHYKNANNLEHLTVINVDCASPHRSYAERQELDSPYNVGLVQTIPQMEIAVGQTCTVFFKDQMLPKTRMQEVYVIGWNTANYPSGEERNPLFEARAVLVEILTDAKRDTPSVTPLKIRTEGEKFIKVDRGCPVIFENQILGVISFVPENIDEPIYMVNSRHFYEINPAPELLLEMGEISDTMHGITAQLEALLRNWQNQN